MRSRKMTLTLTAKHASVVPDANRAPYRPSRSGDSVAWGSSVRSFRRQRLLGQIAELMNIDIQLAFTFAEVAKTTRADHQKVRALRNARKAYETVAKFLSTKGISSDCAAPITKELSRLKQVLVELGESFEAAHSPQLTSVSDTYPTEEFSKRKSL